MALIVITGPPAAGKSTWVRQHAKPGDITIDYDRLALALTVDGSDSHDHPRYLRHVASRARSAAIREALRYAGEVDVYVIHSLPAVDVLARYAEHHARVVTVDPGRDVVMERIRRERPRSMVPVAERWYASVSHTVQQDLRSSRQW